MVVLAGSVARRFLPRLTVGYIRCQVVGLGWCARTGASIRAVTDDGGLFF